MNKIIKITLLFFAMMNTNAIHAVSDIPFVDRMLITNSMSTVSSNPKLPGDGVEIVSDDDNIIYYMANVGVINPTKKHYNIEVVCTDINGNVIIKGNENKILVNFEVFNGNNVGSVIQSLGLDPEPNALVPGQIIPLKTNNDYYIQLYFEKKLIGLTKFHYIVHKKR